MNNEHRDFCLDEMRAPDWSGMRVIRMKRLSAILSVSRSTLYDWLNPGSPRYDPTFPRPIRLAAQGGAVGWLAEDVMRWLNARK